MHTYLLTSIFINCKNNSSIYYIEHFLTVRQVRPKLNKLTLIISTRNLLWRFFLRKSFASKIYSFKVCLAQLILKCRKLQVLNIPCCVGQKLCIVLAITSPSETCHKNMNFQVQNLKLFRLPLRKVWAK